MATTWPPNDETLRTLAATRSYTEIGRQYGVSPDVVFRRMRKARWGDGAPPVAEWHERRDLARAEVERATERYDWLRPVALPAPPPPRAKVKASPRTVVASDLHFGCHDEAALEVLLQTIAVVRPERLLLNGDVVDLLAISKYPKDARPGRTWALRDEVAALHAFLHRAETLGAAWDMAIAEVDDSNHSGNTSRGRWWRYLSDRCPELLGHADAEEHLSYARWFFPAWSRIRLIPAPVLPGGLFVTHGEIVRKHGAYSARAHGEKWLHSVLHGHTHRVGQSVRRVPTVGARGEGLIRAFEAGCLCRLDADYCPAPTGPTASRSSRTTRRRTTSGWSWSRSRTGAPS
jgi:hypothetical protein